MAQRQPDGTRRVEPGHDHAWIREAVQPSPPESTGRAHQGYRTRDGHERHEKPEQALVSGRSRLAPPPTDECRSDQRWDLHLGRQYAEHQTRHEMVAPCHDTCDDEQPQHQRVIVRTAQQNEQDQGIQDGQGEGSGPVATRRLGQDRNSPCHEHDTQKSDAAKSGNGRQHVVVSKLDEATREAFPRRPIGGAGAAPEGIHQAEEWSRSQDVRPRAVRAVTPCHHLTLRGIAVDVPAEQRRHGDHGGGPGNRDGHDRTQGSAGMPTKCPHDLEPRPDHHGDACVHEHDPQ